MIQKEVNSGEDPFLQSSELKLSVYRISSNKRPEAGDIFKKKGGGDY